LGKLSRVLLEKYVFTRTGLRDSAVIVGPKYGEDAAIIHLGDGKILVVHSDPISEAIDGAGWLSVNIACNDVAVRGVKPRWILPVILMPSDGGEELLNSITEEIDSAARRIGVMVVGGHTEYTPRLDRPLISMTAMGISEDRGYVLTGGGKAGDAVLMTKTAAIEGTAILARDFRNLLLKRGVSHSIIRRASEFIWRVSIVKEALILAELGVNAMHDPTAGGILEGLYEIASSSNIKLKIHVDRIPVAEETKVLCESLGLDPLKILGSGSLLALIPLNKVDDARSRLKEAGVDSTVIGSACEGCGVTLLKRDGSVDRILSSVEDDLTRLWRGLSEG